jgi:hypothetical protein
MFAAAGIGAVQLAPYDGIHTVTYTSNYYAERSWFVGHTWSLSVEEQFYLLWPAVLILAGVRRGLWIAAAVVLAVPAIRLFEWFFVPSVHAGIGHRFETVADAIAIGCVLAGTRQRLHNTPLYMKAISSPFFILVPLAAIAGALTHDYPTVSFGAGMTLTNICVALTIDWCVTFHEGRVGRVLNAAPLVFIGWISYSLYLWQQPFLNRASSADIASFPVNLALAFACALVSYFVIERPSLALRKHLEKRLFKSTAATPAVQPAQVVASLALCLVIGATAAGCAAAHGNPVIDATEPPAATPGTVSGIVRAEGANTPLSARKVTAINVSTGEKFETSTAVNGGYTMKLPMGRYRLEVELRTNEIVAKGPGEIEINRSDLDSGRDFFIAVKP